MPIYHFLHEFPVSYRHSVFSAVRRHSVLVICLQAQTVTYTCLFTLSFMNFQSHTDIPSAALYGGILSSVVYGDILSSVAYRHSVFSAVRRHSILTIYLQAETVTYTCLFTLSFNNFQCHTDILSSVLYGGILSSQYVFRHRQLPTHAYLPFPSLIVSAIQTFCLQCCTEAFCPGNISIGTDSNLHMPTYPFHHEFSVAYRHSVFSAVRRHSVLAICLQAQTGTYTCLLTLSFAYFQWHTDILSSALYGGILSSQYVFRHRQ